jgi:putative peptide zinc metalloprotease protein
MVTASTPNSGLLIVKQSAEILTPSPCRKFQVFESEQGFHLIKVSADDGVFSYLKINTLVLRIIENCDGNQTLQVIKLRINEEFDTDLSLQEVESIVYVSLAKIFDLSAQFPKGASYLRLRTTIVGQRYVEKIANSIKHLYTSHNLVFILFMLLLVGLSLFFSYLPRVGFSDVPLWIIPVTMTCSLLLHELGHASACKAYGADPGEIGFGFYLLTPVMFANVSDAWRLKKAERIAVDIAGMFIELALASVLASTYLFTQNSVFYIMSGAVFFNTLMNLNPLLRYDGYWILSDIMGIPNLREKSIATIRVSGKKLFRADWAWFTLRRAPLLGFGIASLAFQFWFLYFISFHYLNEAIALPTTVLTLAGSVIGLCAPPEIPSVFVSIFIPLIFYMMIWNIITTSKIARNVVTHIIKVFSFRNAS